VLKCLISLAPHCTRQDGGQQSPA